MSYSESLLTIAALSSAVFAGLGCAYAKPAPFAASSPRTSVAAEPLTRTSCRTTGDAQVVASNVFANELQVRPYLDGFQVMVLDAIDPCLTVDVAPDGRAEFGGVLGDCPAASPPGEAAATNRDGARYIAHETWDASGARHLTVGVQTWDIDLGTGLSSGRGLGRTRRARPIVVEHPFFTPTGRADDEQTEPKLSAAAGDTFLLVWVEGDVIRGQPVGGWATPAGASLVVSPEGATEVEHPAVAFAPTRTEEAGGMVVYSARTSQGFHVFATPVACTRTPSSGG
jgi:hypothetical protein